MTVHLAWWVGARALTNQVSLPRLERVCRFSLAGTALIGIACEIPYLWFRQPKPVVNTLCVAGDSITAGLNDGEETWPRLLSTKVAARILDASQPGATFRSAAQQVAALNAHPGDLLLLEIGGNDLLEGLPLNDFERDLDRLLVTCQKPDRILVMFELPLPPLAVRYGAIQRRLAQRHGVQLVPRRALLRVLTSAGSTVDGIHLSITGQQRLMELVQKLLKFPH